MTLLKWDPLRDVETLQNRINRMFEDSFERTRDPDDETNMCAWRPPVDIYETRRAPNRDPQTRRRTAQADYGKS